MNGSLTVNGIEIEPLSEIPSDARSARIAPTITINLEGTPYTDMLLKEYAKIPVRGTREWYISQLKLHHIWRAVIIEDRLLAFTIYVPKTSMKRVKDFIRDTAWIGVAVRVKEMENPLKLEKHTYIFGKKEFDK